eukprot:PhM_4_TR10345/c0_g1_i1/m.23584
MTPRPPPPATGMAISTLSAHGNISDQQPSFAFYASIGLKPATAPSNNDMNESSSSDDVAAEARTQTEEELKLALYTTLLHRILRTHLPPAASNVATQLLHAITQKLYMWSVPGDTTTWNSLVSQMRGYLSMPPAYSAARAAHRAQLDAEAEGETLAKIIQSWSFNNLRAQIKSAKAKDRFNDLMDELFERKERRRVQRGVFREWRVLTKLLKYEREVDEYKHRLEGYTDNERVNYSATVEDVVTLMRRQAAQIKFMEGQVVKAKEEVSVLQGVTDKVTARLRTADERASIATEKSLQLSNQVQRLQLEIEGLNRANDRLRSDLDIHQNAPWKPLALGTLQELAQLGKPVIPDPLTFNANREGASPAWYIVREWANDCIEQLDALDGAITATRLRHGTAELKDGRYLARLLFYLSLPRFRTQIEEFDVNPASRTGSDARADLLAGQAKMNPPLPTFMAAFGELLHTGVPNLDRVEALVKFAERLLEIPAGRFPVSAQLIVDGNGPAVMLLLALLYAKLSHPLHFLPKDLSTTFASYLQDDEEEFIGLQQQRIMMSGKLYEEPPEFSLQSAKYLKQLNLLTRTHRETVFRIIATVASVGGGSQRDGDVTISSLLERDPCPDEGRVKAMPLSSVDNFAALHEIVHKYRVELCSVYLRFCETVDDGGTMITLGRWFSFTTALRLQDSGGLNPQEIQAAYFRSSFAVNTDDLQGSHAVHSIEMPEFVEAVVRVGHMLEKGKGSVVTSFQRLLDDRIIPTFFDTGVNIAKSIVAQPEVQKCIQAHAPRLRDVYNLHATPEHGNYNNPLMPREAFYSMMINRGVLTVDLSSDLLEDIVARSTKSAKTSASLTFPQFVEVVCVVGLTKFPNPLMSNAQRISTFIFKYVAPSTSQSASSGGGHRASQMGHRLSQARLSQQSSDTSRRRKSKT